MFVYLITNTATGKYYVGKTVSGDLNKYLNHKVSRAKSAKSGNNHLYNAMRKYPKDSWTIHPLMSTLTTNEALCKWEIELIALFKARDPEIGYNIAVGGLGGGKPHTAQSKVNLSAKLKGRCLAPFDEAHRKHMSESARIRTKNRKGGVMPGLLNPFYGKKHSEETKERLSALRKEHTGWNHTEQTINKMKAAYDPAKHNTVGENNPMYGKKHSEATKQSIREKRLAYYARIKEPQL